MADLLKFVVNLHKILQKSKNETGLVQSKSAVKFVFLPKALL